MNQEFLNQTLQKYKKREAPAMDVVKMCIHVMGRLEEIGAPKGLTEAEWKCLEHLVKSANVWQINACEVEKHRAAVERSRKILLGKGATEKKKRDALRELGLDLKTVKKSQYETMKKRYESLMSAFEDEKKNGHSTLRIGYGQVSSEIRWRNPREKKEACIDHIVWILGAKSRDGVIKQLRKLKTKNLPAHRNSGSQWTNRPK